MSMQEEDGGWKARCMYGYGSTGERIVNKGLTTALAVKAIVGAGLSVTRQGSKNKYRDN